MPKELMPGDEPRKVAAYWRAHVPSHPYFNPDAECLVAIFLNTRRHIMGHSLVSIGTLDAILVHAREVFRAAIVRAASAVVLVHNHPSGDPTPSDSDLTATRDLIRAGLLIKIDVLDHLIMGVATEQRAEDYVSLRELGYFYEPVAAPQKRKPLVKHTVETVVTKNGRRCNESDVNTFIARQKRSSNVEVMRRWFEGCSTPESLNAALSIIPRREMNAVTRFCFRLVWSNAKDGAR